MVPAIWKALNLLATIFYSAKRWNDLGSNLDSITHLLCDSGQVL